MFKRRKEQKISEHLRNLVWPIIGWQRWVQYNTHRVGRLAASTYSIAAGLSCGVAVSFTPFLGFHVLLAVVISYVIRANLFAAAIGTIVGNPWTFPFIWAATYNLGAMLTGVEDGKHFADLIDTDKLLSHPLDALEPVLMPMIHGGLIIGLISGFICYFVFYRLLVTYRKKRAENKLKRRKEYEERLEKITEERDDHV